MGGSKVGVIYVEFTPVFPGTGVGQSVSWSSFESPLESVGLTRRKGNLPVNALSSFLTGSITACDTFHKRL